MMTVRLRMAAMLARFFATERKQPATSASRLELTCWWTDCDMNRHMNNSRYLAYMDMGRWHYMLATHMWQGMRERGWFPVVVRIEIDYKRSIHPGERFVLETELEKVGTKSTTIRQRFSVGGELCAEARVIALFLKAGKSQEIATVMADFPHLTPPAVDSPQTQALRPEPLETH